MTAAEYLAGKQAGLLRLRIREQVRTISIAAQEVEEETEILKDLIRQLAELEGK